MASVASVCGVFPERPERRRRSGEAGFTLVEVMVTVAVLGILAAIAVPSFKGMMPKVRLGNAVQTLTNEIAMSRMAAVAKSTEYQIIFNQAAKSYRLRQFTRNPDSTYTWKENAATLLGSAVAMESFKYENATVVPTTGTPPSITLQLNANGTTSVPFQLRSMRIVLQTPDGNTKKRIVVLSTGRIFTQKWRGGNVDDDANWVED